MSSNIETVNPRIEISPMWLEEIEALSERRRQTRFVDLSTYDALTTLGRSIEVVNLGDQKKYYGSVHIGKLMVASSIEDGEDAFRSAFISQVTMAQKENTGLLLYVTSKYFLYGAFTRRTPKLMSSFRIPR